MTGFELEAVSLLGRAEVMIAKVVDVDPVAYVELQQRVERIWADYVEKSNFAGLGACAALLYPSGRNG